MMRLQLDLISIWKKVHSVVPPLACHSVIGLRHHLASAALTLDVYSAARAHIRGPERAV